MDHGMLMGKERHFTVDCVWIGVKERPRPLFSDPSLEPFSPFKLNHYLRSWFGAFRLRSRLLSFRFSLHGKTLAILDPRIQLRLRRALSAQTESVQILPCGENLTLVQTLPMSSTPISSGGFRFAVY